MNPALHDIINQYAFLYEVIRMKNILFAILCFVTAFVLLIVPNTDTGLMAADVPEETPVVKTTPEPTLAPSPSLIPWVEPAPTPDPTPPPTTTLNIAAVGDLMCLYGQLTSARKGGEYVFDECFAQVEPILSSADLTIGNFETLVAKSFPYTKANSYAEKTITPSDGSAPYTTTVRVSGNPKLNAPESYLKAVVACGFDVLVTANNHAYDRGSQGIVETMSKLDEYGMYHTGSYALPEDKVPLVVNKNGINIGVVSYTDISNNKPKSSDAYMLDRYNKELLAADIEAVKQAGAEFVMVYIHWGNSNTHKVTSRQRKMAQFIADSGADIIFGSHAHCTQTFDTIETQRGTVPVLYSFGNFLSSMGRTMNKDSVIVNLVLEKNYTDEAVVIKELTYIPTLCRATNEGDYVVLPATPEYIETSPYASSLEKSRQRTINDLGQNVATPK